MKSIQKGAGDTMADRLIMFTGTECDHCHEMLPLVKKLEEETKKKVTLLEVWHDAKNKAFLDKIDAGKCGGIPFFFNEKNEKWICGNTSYEKLKEWAA
jgi:thiol-disulfide isomerase/thioredoxin